MRACDTLHLQYRTLIRYVSQIKRERTVSMTAHSPLSHVLDAAERQGQLNVRTAELAEALPGVSAAAVRRAIHRQQAKGRLVRLSRGSEHWLIVPLQYQVSGAPPLETWLDRYLARTLRVPYYVGMLSAAATYGASPQAIMVTQIMVPKPRRPFLVGRYKLVFHVRADAEKMPTCWHETPEGRFKVSTAELTALELVQREAQLGGIARVREVLRTLVHSCSKAGLEEALEAVYEVPAAQRLGVLLALDGQTVLARWIEHWLTNHTPRIISLATDSASRGEDRLDRVFKVRVPIELESINA